MDAITPEELQYLVRALDINSPIRSITTEGDTVILRTAWETIEVARARTTPRPSPGHDDTLPREVDDDLDFTDPPPTLGLDDFTAIDGVGPVTAQRLHDLELYTYDDLRSLFARLTTAQTIDLGIQERTRAQIEGWLAQHLI